jgi:hypothetical protein
MRMVAEDFAAESACTRADSVMGDAEDRDPLLPAPVDVGKAIAPRIVNEISETNAILIISSIVCAAPRGRNLDCPHERSGRLHS